MQTKTVKGSTRAKIATFLMMIGLGLSAFLIDVGGSPGSQYQHLLAGGLIVGACMLVLASAYCIYLASGAARTGQFPSPTAFVPTDCMVRTDRLAVGAAICLHVAAGVGLTVFAILIITL